MKILFAGSYNESSVFTGPEKVASRIFDLASKEFETAFITYFFDGNNFGIFKKIFGKTHIKTNSENKIYRLGLLRILAFAFKFKPDIIHIITFERFAVILYLVKWFLGTRIIYNVHGIAQYEDSVNPNASHMLISKDIFCEKTFFNRSDKLVFLSEISKDTARKYYNLNDDRSVIIPNGIDEIFYYTGKARIQPNNKILRLVFIGEITKSEKGFNVLLNNLNNKDLKLELYVISNSKPDESMSEIMKNIDNLKIHFSEKMSIKKYADFLSDKDVYISTASYEQFSIAAVESMAAGLVPVVSKETGMSSYINKSVNGFVYKERSELIEILSNLNSDRNLLNQISGEAKNIYNELSWENVFKNYKALYQ